MTGGLVVMVVNIMQPTSKGKLRKMFPEIDLNLALGIPQKLGLLPPSSPRSLRNPKRTSSARGSSRAVTHGARGARVGAGAVGFSVLEAIRYGQGARRALLDPLCAQNAIVHHNTMAASFFQ